jgi:hypothetical protein
MDRSNDAKAAPMWRGVVVIFGHQACHGASEGGGESM